MQRHSQRQADLNPVDILLWTFRRNESDVINLYDALGSIMQVSTGGNMLNFGYWDPGSRSPVEAQSALCSIVGKMADLGAAEKVLDVGSGFSEPAAIWLGSFPHLKISCVNVNRAQLGFASGFLKNRPEGIRESVSLVNSTATRLPFSQGSMDRIIALESAQHFRPLSGFVSECKRVLSEDGSLAIAIPVMKNAGSLDLLRLGILSFTWSSEHYTIGELEKEIQNAGMRIDSTKMIGQMVYSPLADYYFKNRDFLAPKILERYPAYVEKILARSLAKMKQVSEKGVIDYVLLKAVKRGLA
ncbi:MAG TPA: methyltransferase domain-containing protein [Candidatus Nitrosotalea sp.]|nr:methyltransferase domain-containing protein [Candidatus Nitrosotalea sp.]